MTCDVVTFLDLLRYVFQKSHPHCEGIFGNQLVNKLLPNWFPRFPFLLITLKFDWDCIITSPSRFQFHSGHGSPSHYLNFHLWSIYWQRGLSTTIQGSSNRAGIHSEFFNSILTALLLELHSSDNCGIHSFALLIRTSEVHLIRHEIILHFWHDAMSVASESEIRWLLSIFWCNFTKFFILFEMLLNILKSCGPIGQKSVKPFQ